MPIEPPDSSRARTAPSHDAGFPILIAVAISAKVETVKGDAALLRKMILE